MEDQTSGEDRRARIVELLKRSRPATQPKRRRHRNADIRIRGNGNVVVNGNLRDQAASLRRLNRQTLLQREQHLTALRDAARRRKIWNVWNFAKVPLLLAAMAYGYAFLVLDEITPFPGWRGLGLMLLSVATCVILFFRDRLQRACDEELRRHEAALTKIHETLAVM